jgi:hypothetical protein
MLNTISIEELSNGRIKTEFATTDGVTHMEIHRHGLSDAKVLRKLQEKKFYQHFSGAWCVCFLDTPQLIQRPTFDAAIDAAQEFIFNRDNQVDYSGFY